MNHSKRAFLKTAGALTLAASITPLAAFAKGAEGVELFIDGEMDGEESVQKGFTLNEELLQKVGDIKPQQRPQFLSDWILRHIRRQFPKMEWEKVQDGMGKEVTEMLAKQLSNTPGWGPDGEGEALPGIKIKVRVKFKPPSSWEASIEISF